jgi:DNA polymerase-3 subunit alpha
LKIIKQKGFSIYFLIVADLIRFARENGILTNIRGSVAGSICSYLLGITTVDPFRFQLPFERFLNPERPSAPDIDMDFADNRRDEVIEYAKKKYGIDAVAQIGTFGTMMARGSVRDVARALGFPYDVGDKISKLIPLGKQGFPMTIDIALEMVEELKNLYESDKATKEIVDMARKIEGCARHISVHAAGVVISPTRVDDFSPITSCTTKSGCPCICRHTTKSIGISDSSCIVTHQTSPRNRTTCATCATNDTNLTSATVSRTTRTSHTTVSSLTSCATSDAITSCHSDSC